MPFVSRIEARAYSRGTEIVDRVKDAILNIYPEAVRESISISTETANSQRDTKIMILVAFVENRKLCEQTFIHIIDGLSQQEKKLLRKTLSRRLDEQCVLFLRIDKQLSYLGEIRLASDPDVISVRVHLREYPKCLRSEAEAFLADRLK